MKHVQRTAYIDFHCIAYCIVRCICLTRTLPGGYLNGMVFVSEVCLKHLLLVYPQPYVNKELNPPTPHNSIQTL